MYWGEVFTEVIEDGNDGIDEGVLADVVELVLTIQLKSAKTIAKMTPPTTVTKTPIRNFFRALLLAFGPPV